jgi:hypothetical protein
MTTDEETRIYADGTPLEVLPATTPHVHAPDMGTGKLTDLQASYAQTHVVVVAVLREVRAIAARLDKLETEARDLASPDKLMELAGKFLGGGFPG